MNEQRRKWHSVKSAAEYFDLKPVTLYSYIAKGFLPPGSVLKLNRLIRVNIEKVEAEGIQERR